MSRRAIVVICVLVGVALTVAFAGVSQRSFIAVWLAPDKTPTPSASMSQKAKDANAKFWDAFHGGRYEQIPEVLEALTAAYIENPRDAETAAHIGFLHIWRLSEQARLDTRSATITDHIVLSRKYFAEAVRLAPDDWRFKGFLASMEIAEGSLDGDSRHSRRIVPISLSTYGFCHGDRGAIGLSRMPMARKRCLKTTRYAVSRSRIR